MAMPSASPEMVFDAYGAKPWHCRFCCGNPGGMFHIHPRVNRLTVHVGTTCGNTFAAFISISAQCYRMLRSEWWEMDAGLLPRAAWWHLRGVW